VWGKGLEFQVSVFGLPSSSSSSAGSSIDKVKVFGRMQGIVGLWMWEDDLQAGP